MVDGDYTYFLKKWEDAHTVEEEEEEITKTQIVKEKKKSREEQKEARRRKKALRDTEAEIHALEAEIESMDETLADPATYEDHRAALELSQKRDATQEKLDALYDEWFALSAEEE